MKCLQKKFKLLRGQSGVSLIEAIVVVGILGLIGVVVIRGLDTNYRAGRIMEEQVTAGNLATAYVEAIRSLPYSANYTSVGDNITRPPQYDVYVSTLCSSDAVNFVTCTGSANETFQKITISVSREGRVIFSMCSFRTKTQD